MTNLDEAIKADLDLDLEPYTVIFYNLKEATLQVGRIYPESSVWHSIPIGEVLTSSTDLPLILTDAGELDVKK